MWEPTRETDAFRGMEKDAGGSGEAEVGQVASLAEPPKAEREAPASPATTSTTQTSSKFVEVPPEELDKIEPPWSQRQPIFSIQTGILVIALIILAMSIWYFLQPPTADQLYRRVMAKVGDGRDSDALLSAAPEIEAFLARYPEDVRASDMREYQQEIDLLRLERRFELQSRQKASAHSPVPIERDYLEALRYAQLDPELGIQKLEALLVLYDYADPQKTSGIKKEENPGTKVQRPVGHTAECLELARRRLAQLKKQLTPAITNQCDLLQGRLDEADRIEPTDPNEADAIRRAVITLYGEKDWAKPYIQRAEAALQRKTNQTSTPTAEAPTSR